MVDRDQNGNVKPDLMTKMQDLAKKVPGLEGYLKREDIRERDKLLREHSAKKMDEAKAAIDQMKQELLSQGKLMLLADLDRLTSQIDRIREKHRFEAHGYSGVFDVVKVNEPELAQLYDYDLELLDHVEDFIDTCKDIAADATDEAAVKEAMKTLRADITELAKLVDDRADVIKSMAR